MFTYRSAFLALADNLSGDLVTFYQQLLEQPPQPHQPGVYAEFQLAGMRLGIFQPKQPEEFAGQSGSMSLCLEVMQLESAIAHLQQMNCPIGEIRTASHGRELYAFDPVGNRLILHESASIAIGSEG